MPGQALVEDVPGIQAQRRPHLHRHARAVERQAPEQLQEAPGGRGGDGQGTQVDGGHDSILSEVARDTRSNLASVAWPLSASAHGASERGVGSV